nr:uncharacterized protein LOC131788279 [Pocillopora verrucosa]
MEGNSAPKMDWTSKDLPTAWKAFRQHCEFTFGEPLKRKSEEEKCNYLMIWVGNKGRNIYNTWELTADEVKKLETFTRGVTEHYDPDEPEVEIFGYNDSLSKEGREWNCKPVDKPIYQEYSPPSDDDYELLSVGNSRVRYRIINASSPEGSENEQQNENDEMAWKRLRPSVLRTKIPLYVIFLISICWKIYLLTNHFRNLSSRATLFIKLITPSCFSLFTGIFIKSFIYPMYNKQTEHGKLLIALFSPLFVIVFKVILRLCAQRLKKIVHPGYSYTLLAPLYFGSAIMFRIIQAELDNLKFIAVLGIIHGAVEVLERSTVVFIDHICHVILKRRSAPWGSFRTPRRERLMADIAILSMLCESTAIESVNGVLYLYQFTYMQNIPLLKLLQEFVIHTAVALVIEWFFTGVSLAIETRFQNIAVMAVWRKRWKRHIFVAMANLFLIALWKTETFLEDVHGRFDECKGHPCEMPFK